MAKKKKDPSISYPPTNPVNPLPGTNDWDFDSLEEKIRGEESLLEAENKLRKEEREVKKKLDDSEIDRRLKALREKIKPKD
jgi:hypothetical protein